MCKLPIKAWTTAYSTKVIKKGLNCFKRVLAVELPSAASLIQPIQQMHYPCSCCHLLGGLHDHAGFYQQNWFSDFCILLLNATVVTFLLLFTISRHQTVEILHYLQNENKCKMSQKTIDFCAIIHRHFSHKT